MSHGDTRQSCLRETGDVTSGQEMGSSVRADSSTSAMLNRAAQMRHHSQSPALMSQPQQRATTSKQTHGASSVPRGDATTGPARLRASHARREGRSGPGTPLEPWGCCSLSLLWSSCFSSTAGTCSSYKPWGQPQRKRHLALLSPGFESQSCH